MSRSFGLSRIAWTFVDTLSTSGPGPIYGIRRSAQRTALPGQLGRRNVHAFTKGDLKQLLPTMVELGLQKGDKVMVAMSGGVDSSVALRVLSEMPLDLSVIFMRSWDPLLSEDPSSEPSSPRSARRYSSSPSSASSSRQPNTSPCAWEKDWNDVQAVAKHVGIPAERVRMVDLSADYWGKVFEPAVRVWEEGGTPNPDVTCNKEIKFGSLLRYVPKGPRSFLATGHYGRVKRVPHATRLCRAKDLDKDQTYYLSSISEAQLIRILLPLGDITKPWVRRLAEYYGLPTAEREESMGLCFVGERSSFGDFISQYTSPPPQQGYLVDLEGNRLGEHKGLWYYTIGQGARIGGMEVPHFVARKGLGKSRQDILVVPRSDHPKLQCTRIRTQPFHWIHGRIPKGIVPGGKKRAMVQLRHRMEPVVGVLSHDWDGKGVTIDFPEPIHGVAPGQIAAVWYQKWCMGSGVIEQTWTADEVPPQTFKEMKGKGKYRQSLNDKGEDEEATKVERVQSVDVAEEKAVMAG